MEASYLDNRRPEVDKLIERLIEAGRLRNQVVHANWEDAHGDGYTRCKLNINAHGVQHEYIQYTSASLKMIKIISMALIQFWMNFGLNKIT